MHAPEEKQLIKNILTVLDEKLLSPMEKLLLHYTLGIVVELSAEGIFVIFFSFLVFLLVCFAVAELLT